MEETWIETCFCAAGPPERIILCEEPISASFCEEACRCGCDDEGVINCVVAEETCAHDAAQTCDAACSCKSASSSI